MQRQVNIAVQSVGGCRGAGKAGRPQRDNTECTFKHEMWLEFQYLAIYNITLIEYFFD